MLGDDDGLEDPDLGDEGAASRAHVAALFPASGLTSPAPGPIQGARPPTTPAVTRPACPSTPRTSDVPVRSTTNSFAGAKLQIYVLTAQELNLLQPGEGFLALANKGDQFSYKVKTMQGKKVVPLPGVYIQHPSMDGRLFRDLHFLVEFADRVQAEVMDGGFSFDDWVALRRDMVNAAGGAVTRVEETSAIQSLIGSPSGRATVQNAVQSLLTSPQFSALGPVGDWDKISNLLSTVEDQAVRDVLEGLLAHTRELSNSSTRGAADILAIFDRLGGALDQGSVHVVIVSLIKLIRSMRDQQSNLLASHGGNPNEFRAAVVACAQGAQAAATGLADAMARLTVIEGSAEGVIQLEHQLTTRLEAIDRVSLEYATRMSEQDAAYRTKMATVDEKLRRITQVETRLNNAVAESPARLTERVEELEAQVPALEEVKGNVMMTTRVISSLSATVLPLRGLLDRFTLLESAVPDLRTEVSEGQARLETAVTMSLTNLTIGDLTNGVKDVETVVNNKIAPITNTLAIIKQKESGAYWVQTVYRNLFTISDIRVIIATLGDGSCIFGLLSDLHGDASAVRDRVYTRDAQRKAARHANDIQFDLNQSDFISSFYGLLPELFCNNAGEFRAVTFEEWDTRTESGYLYVITQGLKVFWGALDSRIAMRMSGNLIFARFATELRLHSELF